LRLVVGVPERVRSRRGSLMAIILIALLVVLILGGLGFVLHVLWWLALAALVIWLVGFLLRAGASTAGTRRRRWYYW
jgi:hypothetical protein